MTTIAYKDGVIAYDSRVTDGGYITDDNFNKRFDVDGVSFFLTGCITDYASLIDAYFGGKPRRHIDCKAFVYDNGEVFECGVSGASGLWKYRMRLDNPAAIGSGAQFALAAMFLGEPASDAVALASKLDSATGGCIRIFSIQEWGALHE